MLILYDTSSQSIKLLIDGKSLMQGHVLVISIHAYVIETHHRFLSRTARGLLRRSKSMLVQGGNCALGELSAIGSKISALKAQLVKAENRGGVSLSP